ncbi:MAG: glycosyltransferase family 39 protein [Patescibacteria group bacterium]
MILIIIILILALSLRLYQLSSPSLWMDEGYTLNAALSILTKGIPVLDSGANYWGAFPHTYLLAGVIKIFGLDLFFLRLPSVIVGTLFILVFYYIVKKLFNRFTGILAAIFVGFSFWQIAWSRQIRMYIFVELFAWLSVYFFWKLITLKNTKDLLRSILFLSIATIFHPVALLLIPIYFLFWLIYFPSQHKKPGLLLLIFAPIFLEVLHFFLPQTIFSPINLIKNNLAFNFYLPSFLEFFAHSWPIFSILTIVGSIWLFTNKKADRPHIFILLIFLLPFIIFSFFFKNLIFRYLFIFTPILFIISAILIEKIYLQIKSATVKIIFFLAVLLSLFLTKELILIPQSFYALESSPISSTKTYLSYTPQPDFAAGYAKIKSNLQAEDIVISAYPNLTKIYLNQPGYWLAFDYLGKNNPDKYVGSSGREIYANAPTINNLEELKKLSSTKKTYILYDQMARDRLEPALLEYIEKNYSLLWQSEINRYSHLYLFSQQ